jgi:hypothetical protein
MTDKEKERRYYQGPSERISLNQEAEYMTASQPNLLKILYCLLQNRWGPYMTRMPSAKHPALRLPGTTDLDLQPSLAAANDFLYTINHLRYYQVKK